MLLEMSKGFQVGPTSNDRKEIKILSVHGKKQFLKVIYNTTGRPG